MSALAFIGGMIWYFGRRNAEAEADSKVTARDLSLKADKHEVSALKDRFDYFDRVTDAQAKEIKTTLLLGLAEIRQDLKAEHDKRGLQYDNIAVKLTDLSGEMISLQTTVNTHDQRIAAIERRLEGRGSRTTDT